MVLTKSAGHLPAVSIAIKQTGTERVFSRFDFKLPEERLPRISTGQIGALASTLVSNQPNAFSKPRNFLPPCSPKPSNTQCVGILDELMYVPTCSAACPSGIYRISGEKENMRKTVACVSLIVSHPRRSAVQSPHNPRRARARA